MTTNCLLK